MNITNEAFSDLLNKYTLIIFELCRLNAKMVYYSDIGNTAKLAQTIDAIKRLEMNKSAIAIEFDKRVPTNVRPNESNGYDIV